MPQHISQLIRPASALPRHSAPDRWWGPIWRGLTVEPTGKHYRAMGTALWLYVYLIVHANRKTGTLFRLTPTMARDMGVASRTVRFWLARLRQSGYVLTASNGRGLTITVLKWKPVGRYKSDEANGSAGTK